MLSLFIDSARTWPVDPLDYLEGRRTCPCGAWVSRSCLWSVRATHVSCLLLSLTFSLVDLYGRGYSDAPQVPYTAGLYTTQLALLLQHVRWEKAHVAGLSMVRCSSFFLVPALFLCIKNRAEASRRRSLQTSRTW